MCIRIMILLMVFLLTGCHLKGEYQSALNNYAKDNCYGKLLHVGTRTLDGTIHSVMWFKCITDKGVETRSITIKDIPVQYWEIPDEPSKYKRKDKWGKYE